MREIKLSGYLTQKRNRWWAYANELPLVSHGRTQAEAISKMTSLAQLYLDTKEAAQSKPPEEPPPDSDRKTFKIAVAA